MREEVEEDMGGVIKWEYDKEVEKKDLHVRTGEWQEC